MTTSETGGNADSAARAISGDTTSLTLLARVRQADQQAWTRLVQLYGPMVYEWCERAGLRPADAADVGQEVFTRVWGAIGGFRRENPGDTFRGWLRVITRRQLLDFWRRQQRSPGQMTVDPRDLNQLQSVFPEVEDEVAVREDRQKLYLRAIELLRTDFEPTTVNAFWKVVVEDQPARDVAVQLNITVNAVYIAKSRVLTRLRAEMSDD